MATRVGETIEGKPARGKPIFTSQASSPALMLCGRNISIVNAKLPSFRCEDASVVADLSSVLGFAVSALVIPTGAAAHLSPGEAQGSQQHFWQGRESRDCSKWIFLEGTKPNDLLNS